MSGAVATAERILAEHISVPPDSDFVLNGDDYLAAPALEVAVDRLIRGPSLMDASEAAITCLWKRKGGKRKGRPTYGECVKPSGLLAHFAYGCEFVVWLAADHAVGLGVRSLEAVLYHQLKHIQRDEDEDGEVTWSVRGHDVETFASEIERYGLWLPELAAVGRAAQPHLPGLGA